MMRMLKMRHDLPGHLENRLVNKWGYAVVHRQFKEYVLFKKSYISDRDINDKRTPAAKTIMASIGPQNLISLSAACASTANDTNDNILPFELDPPVFKGEAVLTRWQEARLARRCDNIVKMFPDPYSMVGPIRTRLGIMSQNLEPAERKYVLEFMDEHFPQ